MKQRQQTFATTGVPTAAMWAGDLSSITDANSDKITIYDPLTPSADGRERPSRTTSFLPTALARTRRFFKVLRRLRTDRMPTAIHGSSRIFKHTIPIPEDQNTLTLKGDHNFSEKDHLGQLHPLAGLPSSIRRQVRIPTAGLHKLRRHGKEDTSVHNEYVRYNHVFSPTLLNQFMVAISSLRRQLWNPGRQHKMGGQAGISEPVWRHRLADGLYRRLQSAVLRRLGRRQPPQPEPDGRSKSTTTSLG